MLVFPRFYKEINETYCCAPGTEFGSCTDNHTDFTFYYENHDYTVHINDVPYTVKSCRVSKVPFNRPWPGKQRSADQTELAGFVYFYGDEKVTIKVRNPKLSGEAVLRPLSSNITVTKDNEDYCFTLTKNGNYVFEIGGARSPLHIFYGKPEDVPTEEKITHYFGPGLHYPGLITLKDNDILYIDKDAYVFGSIYSSGAENIKICGGGVLDNSCERRIFENCYEPLTKGCLRLYDCKNVSIEGIILLDSSNWTLALFGCEDVKIDGVKILGQWRYNTDGIDIVNSRNVTVKNCFIRSFDDSLTIKGIYDCQNTIENISVENCVLWCDWGHTLQIGIETWAKEYRNITFKNCDIIHTSTVALAVDNGNAANIHDIVFENINIELRDDSLPEVIQRSDNEHYPNENFVTEQTVICVDNHRFGIRTKNIDAPKRLVFSNDFGKVNNITFKTINIHSNSVKPIIKIVSDKSALPFGSIKINDIKLNNKAKNLFQDFITEINNAEVITE